ncbi:MAG: 50S ribosomal protein L11 methyltransferase [Firmicutes bacterium]|nr:50S ribosomal protein L11 methyltransferase [Bacillota bacterium]
MKNSYKILIKTTAQNEEIVSYVLFENGALGVEIVDNHTLLESLQNPQNWDYLDKALEQRLSQTSDDTLVVSGFFESDVSRVIGEQLGQLLGQENFGVKLVIEDADLWQDYHKKYFVPLVFDKVAIVPDWIEREDAQYQALLTSNKAIIQLQHLSSFGTGQHETTAMCIDLLCGLLLASKRVVDVGCGTGILGLVARQLGASEVDFFDYDEGAIQNTQANAKINHSKSVDKCKSRFVCASLLDKAMGKYDIILANLTADLLGRLASGVGAHMHKDTRMIVSGIINDRATEVRQAFEDNGLFVQKSVQKGEWTAFLLGVSLGGV